jgi:hypothetical protein
MARLHHMGKQGRLFYAQVDAELEALGICKLTTAEDEEDEFMALQHHT